jgi:predicted pyridoxine 5'-phosphate oxidase superfamily flavin-nucleotide-binding protein
MDFVVPKRVKRKLDGFFAELGYVPEKNFNLLNGDRRQIFYDARSGRRIDVFVGDFEMCHKLPMRNRLDSHPVTIPLAELFLSKTQIVELNRKDALDIISLLLDNEVGFTDDTINIDRIARLCLKDWGLYKTLTINLSKVEDVLVNENPGLSLEDTQRVLDRITTIRRILDRSTKPFLWKVRDRLGTRVRWYTEVEEVNR